MEAKEQECPKRGFCDIIKYGKTENQRKAGYNVSGTQRRKCKECGKKYTINPKKHEYPEETRNLAIEMYSGETPQKYSPFRTPCFVV